MKDIYSEAKNYEASIYNRLLKCISTNEHIVSASVSERMMVDFYMPEGCKVLGWPPNTGIEVKYRLSPDTYYKYRNMLAHGAINFQFIVIICLNVQYDISKYSDSNYIKVYDDKQFSKIVSEVGQKGRAKKLEIPENDDVINRARHALLNTRSTFFLGAGVSMDANLPGWSTLLKSILSSKDGKPYDHINEANSDAIIESCGDSSIIAGRYAFDGFGDMTSFKNRIKDVLYKNIKDSKLINNIGLCIKTGKVDQVITYNYDDLIETELGAFPHYSVFGKNRPDSREMVPIYHVHGMIPQTRIIESTPILSEKEYHDLYRENHNWANVIQLYALNNTTCFFIGLSMTDPNLRRLLDFSRKNDAFGTVEVDRIPHYAFLQKKPLKGEASNHVNQEHWKEQERMMASFGINIIWFDSFEDLYYLIGSLSK